MELQQKNFKVFILAGGRSSRMGFDKALINHPEGGNWLTHKIKIVSELNLETFIMTNHVSHFKEVDKKNGIDIILDSQPFDGPLSCIEQIFSSFKFKKFFIFFKKSSISFLSKDLDSDNIGLRCLTFSNLLDGDTPTIFLAEPIDFK